MARKTYAVEDLKTKINHMIFKSAIAGRSEDERYGLCAVLESVLFDTDNYKGFRFTDTNDGNTDYSQREYF